MSVQSLSRSPATGSRVLLWMLSSGAAIALVTVAVVAWQAANRQRRDGAGAQRQAAAEAATLKAVELEASLNAERDPLKTRFSFPQVTIDRAWSTQPGAPQDWIFGPWPQPENDAARRFNQVTALAHAGRQDEARSIVHLLLAYSSGGFAPRPQPPDSEAARNMSEAVALAQAGRLDAARKILEPSRPIERAWNDPTTSSGLPLRPLLLRLAISLDPANSRHYATELLEAAALRPSPLSIPLLEEAITALPRPTDEEQAKIESTRHRLEYHDRLRAALRERSEDVTRARAWITTAQGDRWHLDYGPDSIQALPVASVRKVAAAAGLGRADLPALPSGWMFRGRLDGVSLTEPDDPSLTPMASHTRGPLVLEVVAHPQTAFAALDSQLLRQRWLIGGATAFIAAAAAAFLLVLTRQRRLNAMMANFVAAVSHELRAPIGSMGLLAERLSDGRADTNGDQAHYHRLLRDECRRLSATIGNVLTFSRRQRGLTAFESELSDLTALLNDTVDLMRPQADERSLILSTDFPDKPVERELDPVIIRQAILNLLHNAIKFSPPGGTVRLRLRESADGSAIITVRDEGPGIPPAERTRIFKPFYRTGSELRRETPGIGIGLAIVHAAATAHNGTATASPAPGQGTEFTLRLPPVPPA